MTRFTSVGPIRAVRVARAQEAPIGPVGLVRALRGGNTTPIAAALGSVTRTQAFDLLRIASQSTNTRIRDVAEMGDRDRAARTDASLRA